MKQPLLEIKNLHAGVENKQILKGITLTINPGEVHAIMGPNGSGKSTLAAILAGRDGYDVTEGSVTFNGKDLLDLDPEERAREGVFLAFQYPVEIPGVNSTYFLKAALNEIRKHHGQPELDAIEFLALVKIFRDCDVGTGNLESVVRHWDEGTPGITHGTFTISTSASEGRFCSG